MAHTSTILEASSSNLDHCAQLLCDGDVVGMPTETVYGLAGNALSEDSVRKIFDVKGRPLIDPLIVHFSNLDAAEPHIESNACVRRLAEAFWPGPLTMVVPKKNSIADIVTAGLPSVAIRVPQHPVFRQILHRLDFPLAAPSANPFGYVSPTLAAHVQQTLGSRIHAILDGGPCDLGLESTILDLRNPKEPAILRHGPITEAQISEALQLQLTRPAIEADDQSAQTAPGRLTKHYSPKATVRLLAHGDTRPLREHPEAGHSTALVLNQKPAWYSTEHNLFWLSTSGALSEIAHNLFDLIQRLDQQGVQQILIEQAPEQGIGKAINDRLRRAAAKLQAID
jgi:L-threonylcarbamoyladenylate synthase